MPRRRRTQHHRDRSCRLAATAFGLGWLVLILGALLWKGFSGLSLRGVHRNDAAAGLRRRPAQSDRRQPDPDGACGRDRHADRHSGRHLHGRIRPPRPADQRRALHQRHSAQRALDRGRPVHLRGHGRADGAFLRPRRRGRAGRHRDSGRGAHHRGHADRWCPMRCAKPPPRSACRARCRSRASAIAPRAPAWSPACCWRSRASAARPRRCCSPRSNNQFWSTNLNAPMASLPVVIFQFALSPYKDWQALAWTGALIITFAVLALSITARALVSSRQAVMSVAVRRRSLRLASRRSDRCRARSRRSRSAT